MKSSLSAYRAELEEFSKFKKGQGIFEKDLEEAILSDIRLIDLSAKPGQGKTDSIRRYIEKKRGSGSENILYIGFNHLAKKEEELIDVEYYELKSGKKYTNVDIVDSVRHADIIFVDDLGYASKIEVHQNEIKRFSKEPKKVELYFRALNSPKIRNLTENFGDIFL